MSIRTICGDCLYVLEDLRENSVDLLIADLPYGQTNCDWDSLIDLDIFWRKVNRVCKTTSPMFFFCTTRFGASLIASNPKHYKFDLVWEKSKSAGFLNAKHQPLRKHEMIYCFYREKPYYNLSDYKKLFDIKKNNNNNIVDSVYGKNSHIQEYTGKARASAVYDPPLPTSILKFKNDVGLHSTQKPVELLKWIIKHWSREGDVVLDPTMGSGSTGIACRELNRKFIGIEKDEEIYAKAIKRLFD